MIKKLNVTCVTCVTFSLYFVNKNLVCRKKTGKSFQMTVVWLYAVQFALFTVSVHYYWLDNTFRLACECNSSH